MNKRHLFLVIVLLASGLYAAGEVCGGVQGAKALGAPLVVGVEPLANRRRAARS